MVLFLCQSHNIGLRPVFLTLDSDGREMLLKSVKKEVCLKFRCFVFGMFLYLVTYKSKPLNFITSSNIAGFSKSFHWHT